MACAASLTQERRCSGTSWPNLSRRTTLRESRFVQIRARREELPTKRPHRARIRRELDPMAWALKRGLQHCRSLATKDSARQGGPGSSPQGRSLLRHTSAAPECNAQWKQRAPDLRRRSWLHLRPQNVPLPRTTQWPDPPKLTMHMVGHRPPNAMTPRPRDLAAPSKDGGVETEKAPHQRGRAWSGCLRRAANVARSIALSRGPRIAEWIRSSPCMPPRR